MKASDNNSNQGKRQGRSFDKLEKGAPPRFTAVPCGALSGSTTLRESRFPQRLVQPEAYGFGRRIRAYKSTTARLERCVILLLKLLQHEQLDRFGSVENIDRSPWSLKSGSVQATK